MMIAMRYAIVVSTQHSFNHPSMRSTSHLKELQSKNAPFFERKINLGTTVFEKTFSIIC